MKRKTPESLTSKQHAFLRMLRKFQKDRKDFGYREICTAMGWRSVNSSWKMVEELVAAGLVRRGLMLARIEAPVLTDAGLRQLRRAA